MKKGDIFYVADNQTNTILKRTVLDIVDGQVKSNFRDNVIQSTSIEDFYKYNKFKNPKEAEQHIKSFRTKEIAAIEMKIQKLRKNKNG